MRAEHTLHVDGHTLVIETLNPGTVGAPTVLLHGVTASTRFWLPEMLPLFLERGPCYALSLPGHYPAQFPADFRRADLTAALFPRLLLPALREVVGPPPEAPRLTLMGHSTGGFAALALAAHAPELVARVICLDGFARGRWTGALGLGQGLVRSGKLGEGAFKAVYEINKKLRRLQPLTWKAYFKHIRHFYAYPHFDALFESFYTAYRHLDMGAMAHYFGAMPDIDITPWLARITAPVLVLTGDSDPIVPPAEARHIAAHLSRARLVVIENAGHIPALEQPEATERAIADWLAMTEM